MPRRLRSCQARTTQRRRHHSREQVLGLKFEPKIMGKKNEDVGDSKTLYTQAGSDRNQADFHILYVVTSCLILHCYPNAIPSADASERKMSKGTDAEKRFCFLPYSCSCFCPCIAFCGWVDNDRSCRSVFVSGCTVHVVEQQQSAGCVGVIIQSAWSVRTCQMSGYGENMVAHVRFEIGDFSI